MQTTVTDRELESSGIQSALAEGGRRELLEAEFGIRVMTGPEFRKICLADGGGERESDLEQ